MIPVGKEMKKYSTGYTQGVFDMFHVGHLNLLNKAKEMCDRLVVGVNSDELTRTYKGKAPVIPEEERLQIVENIRSVDEAFICATLDKSIALRKYGFDVIFIGDDWKGDPRWEKTESEMAREGVDVVYLPYTRGVSSTELRVLRLDDYDGKTF